MPRGHCEQHPVDLKKKPATRSLGELGNFGYPFQDSTIFYSGELSRGWRGAGAFRYAVRLCSEAVRM